ncbi:MAG: hypothetical protein WC196_07195 [Bacilli bacterium]
MKHLLELHNVSHYTVCIRKADIIGILKDEHCVSVVTVHSQLDENKQSFDIQCSTPEETDAVYQHLLDEWEAYLSYSGKVY